MAGNTFGKIFKVTTFGESHGPAVGVVIDGVPPGLKLNEKDIQPELDRRKPGQNRLTTSRQEKDKVQIISGIIDGKTTGTPLAMLIPNQDHRSGDYAALKDLLRPGHADFTILKKFGIRDHRGGGRTSGRETACRVAAGAVAKKILAQQGIKIWAYTLSVGNVSGQTINLAAIEKNPVRAADLRAAKAMVNVIEAARDSGDSIGGTVEAIVKGCPAGLGDPVFDKLNAKLSHALMSIGAIKGIEFGDGFGVAKMRGSQNNDCFTAKNGKIETTTNHCGGILGGMSTGGDIVLRVAVKPPASIAQKQETVTAGARPALIEVRGRHDPCLCPRIVPVIEAMIAITLVDCWLMQKTIK